MTGDYKDVSSDSMALESCICNACNGVSTRQNP